MALKIQGGFGRGLKQNLLVPHLDAAVAQDEFEWTLKCTFKPKKDDDAWHPSTHCTPSMRDLYLMATGRYEERKRPAGINKTFAVGHFFHQYLQHVIVRAGLADWEHIERKGEKRWDDGPFCYAKGAGDIAPLTLPKHGEYLVDIKTMNSHDFRADGLPLWARDKYEAQINIYMDFFDLERAIILGVQKDSPHDLKEIIFTRNQPLIDAIYLKWQIVGECLKEQIEPPEDEEILLPLRGPSEK